MPKPASVVPWSYSSLTSYETCPRRHKLTRLTKEVTEPQSEAMMHGNEVHKALELATKGEQALPPKYKQYIPIVERLRAAPGKKLIEHKWGLTKSLKPTTFFANDVWARGVIDFGTVTPKSAILIDHKTGKPKSDFDQLKLFAGVAFATFPYVESVKTGYLWLAHCKTDRESFTRADVPVIWQDFVSRVARMETSFANDDFPPKPSGLCGGWCPVPNRLCSFSGKA